MPCINLGNISSGFLASIEQNRQEINKYADEVLKGRYRVRKKINNNRIESVSYSGILWFDEHGNTVYKEPTIIAKLFKYKIEYRVGANVTFIVFN